MTATGRPPQNRRLAEFGTTIFAEMSALAVRTGAINLGQGFPDTDGPEEVREAAVRALREGHGNQYPPGPGIPELRRSIAEHQEHWYGHLGVHADPETEVLVTAGATEAITAALLGLLEPGDEVIALEPYYDSYAAAIAMAGGTRVPVTLRPDPQHGTYRLDLDELRASVTPRTRLILLNSPHNPTGTVLSRTELAAIAELCVERELLAVTDEVYEHLVFSEPAGREHIPLGTFPGMAERTVTISSAGKTFSCTGWKIGWACGTPDVVAAVRAAKQFLTFVSGGPFQVAVAHALRNELPWVEQQRQALQSKRDRLSEGLADAGFGVLESAGTYFVCADVRPLGIENATELAWQLPERIGVAAVPVSSFSEGPEYDHLLRFAFCKQDHVLDEAVRRLRTL